MVGLMLLASSQTQAAPSPSRSGSPTILVVDDEPDIRHAVKGILEATLQARVLVAGSGREALDVLNDAGNVELIVTDFRMPGMNGVEFLRQALANHPGIPAVLITAFERELMDATEGTDLARTVLTKPLNPRPMVQTIQRLLAEAQNT